jgi:hypothetical protein
LGSNSSRVVKLVAAFALGLLSAFVLFGSAGAETPPASPPPGLTAGLAKLGDAIDTALKRANSEDVDDYELVVRARAITDMKIKLVRAYFGPAVGTAHGLSYADVFVELDRINRLATEAQVYAEYARDHPDDETSGRAAKVSLAVARDAADAFLKSLREAPEADRDAQLITEAEVLYLNLQAGIDKAPPPSASGEARSAGWDAVARRANRIVTDVRQLIIDKYFNDAIYGVPFSTTFRNLDVIDLLMTKIEFVRPLTVKYRSSLFVLARIWAKNAQEAFSAVVPSTIPSTGSPTGPGTTAPGTTPTRSTTTETTPTGTTPTGTTPTGTTTTGTTTTGTTTTCAPPGPKTAATCP